MPPSKHALLGASSAARWIACTPSARATEGLPDQESTYAAEGTRAHEVCEKALRYKLAKWEAGKPFDLLSDWAQQSMPTEMFNAANQYVSFLHDQWVGFSCRPGVFIEQEVDVSRWVPGGFGTCDCLMIGGGLLHIIDFKYGQGVPVSPVRNPQLMYYALGAYALFDGLESIDTVRMSIVQPRIQEEPETWELPLSDLLSWAREVLQPAAEMAWRGEGTFCPGEHCRFCKAHPGCRGWQEKYGPLAGFEPLPQPAILTDEELGEWLQKVEGLAAYARELEDYAQTALLEGRTLPGWKLVQGRSTRKWTDQDAAFRQMEADGIDEAMLYTRTPISLTAAEKMLGKKKFAEVMSAFITRAPGAPKLAKDSDPRPAYDRLEGFKPEED
nr:MAG TPA: Protein of unknown function (DUF2800) [Caudoviricetes sp.]